MQNDGNNGGFDVKASRNTEDDGSDQFFLDPKVIYEQREKLVEKEAREGPGSSTPGAHSSVGKGDTSQTTSTGYDSRSKAASLGVSQSTIVIDKGPKRSERDPHVSPSSDDDEDDDVDEFEGYLNPQEIHDQREKLAAKERLHVGASSPVGAVPSSSSQNASRTDSRTTTGSSSRGKGSKRGKDSRHKKKLKTSKTAGTSSPHGHPRVGSPAPASLVIPDDNDDPVIIAMATKVQSGRQNPSKCLLICIVLSVLVVGGGIGAAVVLLGKSSPANTNQESTVPIMSPTGAPVANNPTHSPTITVVTRPSEQDCEAIANGDPVEHQDQLTPKRFVMLLEVSYQKTLLAGEDSVLDPLIEWIKTIFLPNMANCEMEKQPLRALRSRPERKLQSTQTLIGDVKLAKITEELSPCDESSSPNGCSVVELVVDLFLRGPDERSLPFISLIGDTFEAQALDLPFPLQIIKILSVLLDETSAPSLAPIMAPTIVAIPTPTTRPPAPRPTESPIIECDTWVYYFQDAVWFEPEELPAVDEKFMEVECGEELRLIVLDLGPSEESCPGVPTCIDSSQYHDIEEACLAADDGADGIVELVLFGDFGGRNIVFGYENVDIENPCTGIPQSGDVVVEGPF